MLSRKGGGGEWPCPHPLCTPMYPWLTPVLQLAFSRQNVLFKDKIYEPNKWPGDQLKIHKNNLWQQRPRVTHFIKKNTKKGKNPRGGRGKIFWLARIYTPEFFQKSWQSVRTNFPPIVPVVYIWLYLWKTISKSEFQNVRGKSKLHTWKNLNNDGNQKITCR